MVRESLNKALSKELISSLSGERFTICESIKEQIIENILEDFKNLEFGLGFDFQEVKDV